MKIGMQVSTNDCSVGPALSAGTVPAVLEVMEETVGTLRRIEGLASKIEILLLGQGGANNGDEKCDETSVAYFAYESNRRARDIEHHLEYIIRRLSGD